MTVEDRGRTAGQRTVATFVASTDVALDYDHLVDRRRSQRRNHTVALAATLVVAVFAVVFVQSNLSADSTPVPMEPVPGLDIGDVPVWYDDAGLHRGDVVEQTPVELRQLDGMSIEEGALALVRTGALYQDPATDDVWFHPWGGDPRIVGDNSTTGPSADPSGDIAVWFEGSHDELCCNVGDPELVVYDTAAGREIARKMLSDPIALPFGSNTCHSGCMEHAQPGNGFLQVSAERVAWTAGQGFGPSYIFDVRTGKISSVANLELVDGHPGEVVDVHDDAAAYAVDDKSPWGWHLVLDMPDRAPQEYPEVNPRSRFSPSGNYVLSVAAWVGGMGERDAAAIIDTRTGELWPVPKTGYSWTTWSYGNIALVAPNNAFHSSTEDELLACDAARRSCETLPAEPPFLMPTN